MATTSAPPAGFVSLDIVPTRLNEDLNVIGVVTDFLPPAKSRGHDYMCSFTLCDLSPSSGQLVKFFRSSMDALPQIQGNGDVVILRQVQVCYIHTTSLLQLISSDKTMERVPRISKTGSIQELKPVEVRYSVMLANALSHHRTSAAVVPSPFQNLPSVHQPGSKSSTPASQRQQAPERQKFSLIRDVESAQFYDIVGEVVKTFPSSGSAFEVYVTDYTSNENLFNYEWTPPSDDYGGPGDEYGYIGRRANRSWPGPYGKLTLRVTLWPPHSIAAQSTIKEGDYVELENVRIKFDQHAQLEGTVHGDRRYPDKIQVRRITDKKDERYLGVLKRKRSYGKKIEKEKGDFLEEVGRPMKRYSDDSGDGNGTAQKRPKKMGNERGTVQNKRRNQAQGDREARVSTQKRHKEEEIQNGKGNKVVTTRFKLEVNKHILCAHMAKPVTPVSQILAGVGRTTATDTNVTLNLPFQNICCRAKIRIIDFFPPNLEDFAVPFDEFEDLPDDSDEESDRDDRQRRQIDSGLRRVDRWEWMFYLLVEDATSRNKTGPGAERDTMKLLVADRDAEHLLKMDAKDLRRNPDTLNLLREKLFILWGNLEERKSNSTISALRELNPNNKSSSISDAATKVEAEGLALSSARAFECCIKEYGILDVQRRKGDTTQGADIDDYEGTWLRRFRMFGTVINAH
ncbi:hypothetical protein GP486_001626 [Trichoglossum hirsutum]|uniref:Protection of telomeres protein 1 n=1 Tax=Trichoglossum hirsutum TaxID=265104 RepID=A0A9P8RSX6_9PEZI|nr:hypothetical protein GP486_001626 [Trichoglossum hirsutum]